MSDRINNKRLTRAARFGCARYEDPVKESKARKGQSASDCAFDATETEGDIRWAGASANGITSHGFDSSVTYVSPSIGILHAAGIKNGILMGEQGAKMVREGIKTHDVALVILGLFRAFLGALLVGYKVSSAIIGVCGVTAIKVAKAVSSTLATVAISIGLTLYTAMAIPPLIKAFTANSVITYFNKNTSPSALDDLFESSLQNVELLDVEKVEGEETKLKKADFAKKEEDLSNKRLARIKLVAPEAYAKLQAGARGPYILEEMLLEAKATRKLQFGVAAFFIAATIATVLATVFTGGVGAIVAAVINIVVGATATALDGAFLIKGLKQATHLSKKDAILKAISIAVAVTVIALAIICPLTAPIMIATIAVAAMALAVPLGSIIYLKVKEKRLEHEYYDKLLEMTLKSAAEERRRLKREAVRKEFEETLRIESRKIPPILSEPLVVDDVPEEQDEFLKHLESLCEAPSDDTGKKEDVFKDPFLDYLN